jgi:hypothetical protein
MSRFSDGVSERAATASRSTSLRVGVHALIAAEPCRYKTHEAASEAARQQRGDLSAIGTDFRRNGGHDALNVTRREPP